LAIIVLGAALAAGAQVAPQRGASEAANLAAPNGAVKQLTGKERLGEKWEDEQRIDNCKVPLDKRGTTPRPDSCAHAI
jgi:hypothetical protein